jgi:AraC-like DNA-binding protein
MGLAIAISRRPPGDSFSVGPFRLRFDFCRPNQEIEQADDSPGEILIVAQGQATQILDDRTQLCLPLSVSYRPPAYPKRDRTDQAGMLALRIRVQALFARRIDREYFAGNKGPLHYPCAVLDDLPARILDECSRGRVTSRLFLDGLLRELIARAARAGEAGSQPHPPTWLAKGTELIEESLRDPLKIEEVARAVGVGPDHFSRVFRRARGVSPKRFACHLRLQEGASMLAMTLTRISDIAAELGFFDQSHFTREFKRWSGRSPETFRREHRCPP